MPDPEFRLAVAPGLPTEDSTASQERLAEPTDAHRTPLPRQRH